MDSFNEGVSGDGDVGKCLCLYTVPSLSECSLFQDTVANLSRGPEPPYFKQLIIPLIPNIADKAPIGKNFGDVLQPLDPKYRVVRFTKRSWNASEKPVFVDDQAGRGGIGAGGERCCQCQHLPLMMPQIISCQQQ